MIKMKTCYIGNSSFFVKLMFVLLLSLCFFSTALAQTPPRDFTLLEGSLPGVGAESNINEYLPAAFNLTVGIALVLAFIFITIGGVTYATSDALSGKAQGRDYIENAVLGLLLIIGSYVILSTINPQILNFTILIARPEPVITDSVVTPVIPSGACTSGCVSFPTPEITLKAGLIGTTISSIMLPRILSFDSVLDASGISWYVSEGFPPTQNVQHTCTCHATGTCIDANIVGVTTAKLNIFSSAVTQQPGMRAVYEVQTEEQSFNLTSPTNRDGSNKTNFVPYRGEILVVPTINAPHFSVYNTSCHQ